MRWKGFIIAFWVIVVAALVVAGVLSDGNPRQSVVASGVAVHRPSPPARVNTAAYNAKLLALDNAPPRPPCETPTTTASAMAAPAKVQPPRVESRPVAFTTKAPTLPPCKPSLWPAHAVYPDAGAVLPFKRVVAYYGNFYSTQMGILGEYPPDKVLAMLESAAGAWAVADPTTPVVPALDYIAVSAQGLPGRDGEYRMRMPPGQIEKAITLADRIHGLLFLDVQPGWSTVEIEVPRLAPYLKYPNVELALDPEFALEHGKRPGAWIGTLNATDINFAARFLAKIVRKNHLPPKILVVHRFTERMVSDFHAIKPLPEVEIVMDMDGFGAPSLKVATYKAFIASQPVQFTGFKLFYKNDVKIGHHLMTPAEVLRLSPQPSYILYQ